MAKFTRRRWRRPERMTLEHPPVMRRKDIGVPTQLMLEPDLARRASRRRLETLLLVFLGLCAVEGLVVALLTGVWVLLPAVLGLGVLYFFVGRERGDAWLERAFGTRGEPSVRLRRLVVTEARRAGVPEPEVLVGPGAEPNALALSLRRRALVVTAGSEEVDDVVLEGMIAHEIVHLRDGEATAASLYLIFSAAPQLLLRGAGVALVLAVPLWPVCAAMRLARTLAAPADREHRADVAGALLTRYPPGVAEALRHAGGTTCGLAPADELWFVPRGGSREEAVAAAGRRAALVAEM